MALSEDIKLEFPTNYKSKDSLNFKVFSAEIPEGSVKVTRTLERTHTLSWDQWGIIEIYNNFRKEVLEQNGGELISDEIVEFQNVKTAKFVVAKESENSGELRNYYLLFYHKGHVYTFELFESKSNSSIINWENEFYDGINIANFKNQFLVKSKAPETHLVDQAIKLIPFAILLLILAAVVIITIIILSRRTHKKSKSI